jgi:hypothetical protein
VEKIENWQNSSVCTTIFFTIFSISKKRINSITMAPPQVEQAVAQVDQFMKNYPMLTQHGKSCNVVFISWEGMVVSGSRLLPSAF